MTKIFKAIIVSQILFSKFNFGFFFVNLDEESFDYEAYYTDPDNSTRLKYIGKENMPQWKACTALETNYFEKKKSFICNMFILTFLAMQLIYINVKNNLQVSFTPFGICKVAIHDMVFGLFDQDY